MFGGILKKETYIGVELDFLKEKFSLKNGGSVEENGNLCLKK